MNQNALITGSSKRIGQSMARHLAAQGWSIIIHYKGSAAEATDTAEELAAQYPGQQFRSIRADLSRADEVVRLIETACRELGTLNLLINNASVFDPGYIAGTSLDLLDTQFNVNFKAPFILMRDFKNLCKKGNIINICDTRITVNKSNFAAYSLSKKVLWELTKMAALEFAPDIRVNAIAPGATLTSVHGDESQLIRMARQTPMKKPGGLEPVLKCLDFILENNDLTGQLLFADGGENLGLNS